MQIEKIKDWLRDLASRDLSTCLDELQKIITQGSRTKNSVLINQSNLSELKSQKNTLQIAFDEFQRGKATILHGVLETIDNLGKSDFQESFLRESEDQFSSIVYSSKIDAIESRLESIENVLQKVTDYYSTVKIKESDLEWWERLDDVWKHNFSQICGVNPSPEDVEFLLETESLTIEPIAFPRAEGKRLKIKDLSPLTRFLSLKSLNISNSEVKSLEPIRNFQLTYLNIVGAPIKSLRPIINMTSLKTVKWGENEFLTMETIQSLKKSLPKCKL